MRKAAVLTLIFLGLLGFFNAIRHPFVHDDVVFILNNPHISELNHWVEPFQKSTVADGLNTYYRPVLELLNRFEYRLFGLNPHGFHLFNVIVHIVNGLLLFGLLQKLGIREAVAWVIACIFLIHPVQSETVSCISGISNLWMALGVLLALHAYLNKWYVISLIFFVIACLSKEQGILFVPLVIVIDYSRGIKDYRSWSLWTLAAFVLMGLRQSVTGASLFKDIMASPGELYLRLAAIPRVLEMDLQLIFFPYDLHYYRSTDILQSNFVSWVFALISLIGVLYIFKRWPQARGTLILGLGWFLAALLPVLNIVPLINEYSFLFTPEHFLYLPIIGILILVAVLADYSIKKYRKLILGFVIGGCLLLTWYQNTFWSSEIVLFERMLRFEPNFGRGHLLLAKAYYFNGRPEQADEHFSKAFTIMSAYAKKATNIKAETFYLVFLKEILFDWAQNDCARGYWTRGLDKYKRAAAIDGHDASLYNNMAFVYLHLGDKKSAYLSLEQAVHIDPSFLQAQRNLQQLGGP